MFRQRLDAQEPVRARPRPRKGPRKPLAKTAEDAAVGTLLKPYVRREDGAEMVRVSFRVSVDCARMCKALGIKLEMDGMRLNTWVEELIRQGIAAGYRPSKHQIKLIDKPEAKPPEPPEGKADDAA